MEQVKVKLDGFGGIQHLLMCDGWWKFEEKNVCLSIMML